jgi:hypothetical protein
VAGHYVGGPMGHSIVGTLLGAGYGVGDLVKAIKGAWARTSSKPIALDDVPKMTRDELAHALYKETHGSVPKTASERVQSLREFQKAMRQEPAAKANRKAPSASPSPAGSPGTPQAPQPAGEAASLSERAFPEQSAARDRAMIDYLKSQKVTPEEFEKASIVQKNQWLKEIGDKITGIKHRAYNANEPRTRESIARTLKMWKSTP